ncbi:hypothetical protein CLOP_g14490 [Closterium sp. NIES-67]|nr:hypothetical protein CLOP_g14490 [Closterium sp. NIES-67]
MLSSALYNDAINCDFSFGSPDLECRGHINAAFSPWYDPIDPYNIYAPFCLADVSAARLSAFVRMNPRLRFSMAAQQQAAQALQQQQQQQGALAYPGDPSSAAPQGARLSGKAADPLDSAACMDAWVQRYLRSPAVYRTVKAPAARAMQWSVCTNGIDYSSNDQGADIIPTIQGAAGAPPPLLDLLRRCGQRGAVHGHARVDRGAGAGRAAAAVPLASAVGPGGRVGDAVRGADMGDGEGAGHQVPTGKPEEAFALFQAFLSGHDPPYTASG